LLYNVSLLRDKLFHETYMILAHKADDNIF